VPQKAAEAQHTQQHLERASQEESRHHDCDIDGPARRRVRCDDSGGDERHRVGRAGHQNFRAAENCGQNPCRDGTVEARLRPKA